VRGDLNPKFIADLTQRARLEMGGCGSGDLKKTSGRKIFSIMPMRFFIPNYRERYEFLKIISRAAIHQRFEIIPCARRQRSGWLRCIEESPSLILHHRIQREESMS